ncbi:unnamed protein product [Porites lobata]|uniref:Uncharacterized protein n=1 Tax=Porites lobata TaxID=104759 RepID=A0ABN8S2X1_9CNID|nr:unnamed protein product [Porites lobata]
MFVKMLCESLHKEIDDFPLYSGSFAENFVCNPESELCMLGKCKKCAKCPSLLQKIRSSSGNLDEHATWYQWEHVEQMVQAKKGKSMKRVTKIQKVLKEGTVDDLLEDLEVQLPSFLEHVFVKRQQARIFKEKIEHLTEEEAVVQVDFAENFSCNLEPLRNGLIRCRTFSYQSTWIEMGVQLSGSENEDLDQNDSDDQDSSSLSKGSNSTSSADEDETSGEKGDFFSNAKERASNANKSSSDEEEMSEKKDIQVQQGLPDKLLSPIYSKDVLCSAFHII